MTESELHAVMTGGLATIAGSLMAVYILFGVSASHIISASVMSAPAALAMSKLMYPETEEPEYMEKVEIEKTQVLYFNCKNVMTHLCTLHQQFFFLKIRFGAFFHSTQITEMITLLS